MINSEKNKKISEIVKPLIIYRAFLYSMAIVSYLLSLSHVNTIIYLVAATIVIFIALYNCHFNIKCIKTFLRIKENPKLPKYLEFRIKEIEHEMNAQIFLDSIQNTNNEIFREIYKNAYVFSIKNLPKTDPKLFANLTVVGIYLLNEFYNSNRKVK